MRALQSISGHSRPLFRLARSNYLAAPYSAEAVAPSSDEYGKRNYAKNVSEYNTVLTSLVTQRRHFLLRDVYEDMLLDGVQPIRDTFHSLMIGTMKGSRLQDAFFFRDEMKTLGLVPDVALYNFLISTCGKCKISDPAIHLLEEMKRNGVKPNGQTFICLLNACAATGRIDQVIKQIIFDKMSGLDFDLIIKAGQNGPATRKTSIVSAPQKYAIVRDMTAAGLGLNKFCYAGLITAHKNKSLSGSTDDTTTKIIELVRQSKGWSSVENPRTIAENVMMDVSEEELYNLPTADYVNKRMNLFKQLTVYHVAFHACADLKSIETMEMLLEMLKQDGFSPDVFIVMQQMRCYLHCGDIDQGIKTFEEYINSGKPPVAELYMTLVEGAMVGYTPHGMQIAQDTLEKMNSRNFFLNAKMGSDLLLAASGEKTGGFTTANYLWDLMQSRRITPSFAAVEAYYRGLKQREIPPDDPRLLLVGRTLDRLRARFGASRPPLPRQREELL